MLFILDKRIKWNKVEIKKDESLGQKIDKKDAGHGLVQINGCKEEGNLKEWKGQDCFSLECIHDSGKRCQMVEDINLQLRSEEWLIRRHLWINGNNIFCDKSTVV